MMVAVAAVPPPPGASSSRSRRCCSCSCFPPVYLRTFLALLLLSSLWGAAVFVSEETRWKRLGLRGPSLVVPAASSPPSSPSFSNRSAALGDDDGRDDTTASASSPAAGAPAEDPRTGPQKTEANELQRSCSAVLSRLHGGREGDGLLGAPGAWNSLRGRVLASSYFAPEHYGHPRLGPAYRAWVDEIFAFYTAGRLRRSSAHPASERSVRKVLRLLADRIQLLDNNNSSGSAGEDPIVEPIRVLVMGGSVTLGNNCMANSEVPGLPVRPRWVDYAWPSRLERMLNGVFDLGDGDDGGGGIPDEPARKLFAVNNYAMGSTNSEMGASMLENHLVHGIEDDPPHLVILSYSTNDSRDPDLDVTFRVHQQALVRAAMLRVRDCDDDLPLVVLADDVHGALEEAASLEVTGGLYKVASWHDVMMVAYGNVARPSAVAHYRGINASFALYGSSFVNSHLGMGFHIGMAWTVLYNLLGALHETCAGAQDHGGETATPSSSSPFDEPPIKHQGPIDSMDKAAKRWREAIDKNNDECRRPRANATANAADSSSASTARRRRAPPPLRPYSNQVCAYAWMVNRVNVRAPRDVAGAMEPVLERSSGWEAKNYTTAAMARAPGFGTDGVPNATFELLVRNVTLPTRFLTVYSMKSYGPAFAGSRLALSIRVERGREPAGERDRESTLPNGTAEEEEEDGGDGDAATYEILGYHDLKTSVFFPHKFALPGGGAGEGDSVRVAARLASGRSFKISGLALCQS